MVVTQKKAITIIRKCLYIFFAITFFVFWMLYTQTSTRTERAAVLPNVEHLISVDLKYLLSKVTSHSNDSDYLASKYLVNSTKCKIPSLDPHNAEILPHFNPKRYIKCRTKNLLTYVTKRDNVGVLHVDERFVNEYSEDGVIYCCYKSINRMQGALVPDMVVNITPCKYFKKNTTFPGNYVVVFCKNNKSEKVYENVHATITLNGNVEKKMLKYDSATKKKRHLNILLVGIDSISRLHMARSLPKTHFWLQENEWLEFKGYNKIGDNTFPNIMGFLTGMNETTAFKNCNPRIIGNLDECNMIWYDYRDLGFITGYAEDEAEINTFNYLKKGFKREPTDYYFRTYITATEIYLDSLSIDVVKYCTGPETAGERIFNLARDFTSTFKDYPNFGFFWMNSFSHNDINAVSRMDEKVADFLKDINKTNILENTFVIFLSDHGFRFGTFTYTHTGWLEERLPFLYLSVPKWFQDTYPDKYKNLVRNSKRLTTPYDLYMTFQDILVISGTNYTVKESSACPKCKSLFQRIETERSCEDAGIEPHWCTCNGYFGISPNSLIAHEAAKFILNEIRKVLANSEENLEKCIDFEIKKIISASISDTDHKNVYILITFETNPHAVFRGTMGITNTTIPNFKIEGSISRLDVYSGNSWCVEDSILQKYCYCRNVWSYAFRIIGSKLTSFANFFRSGT